MREEVNGKISSKGLRVAFIQLFTIYSIMGLIFEIGTISVCNNQMSPILYISMISQLLVCRREIPQWRKFARLCSHSNNGVFTDCVNLWCLVWSAPTDTLSLAHWGDNKIKKLYQSDRKFLMWGPVQVSQRRPTTPWKRHQRPFSPAGMARSVCSMWL